MRKNIVMQKSGSSLIRIIFLAMNLTFLPLSAQDNINIRKVRVIVNDTTIVAGTLGDVKIKVKPDVYYYWYSSSGIHVNQGGYSGNLLHGEYLEMDGDNNLVVKGIFLYGLKSGKWLTWYENGQIKDVHYWDQGKLNGESISFDINGDVVSKLYFKNNLIHGPTEICKNDSLFKQRYYRGIIKSSKYVTVAKKD